MLSLIYSCCERFRYFVKIKKQAFSVLSEKILYKSHETVHLLFRGFLDLGNYI